jgi:hypothetical protein
VTGSNGEKVFSARDIIAIRVCGTGGVYSLAHDRTVAVFPASRRLTGTDDGAMRGLSSLAQKVARRSDIRAVMFSPAGIGVSRQGLALAFADHLGSIRARRGLTRVCVTCPLIPDIESPSLTRLPHFVSFEANGRVTDLVVWELMETHDARPWLGMPFPAERFEGHLARLLDLRRSARLGQLPPTDDGNELRELLTDRYFSIKLVYEHSSLFRRLVSIDRRKAPEGA